MYNIRKQEVQILIVNLVICHLSIINHKTNSAQETIFL